MKSAAFKWLQKVPRCQHQSVCGYLTELRELFPLNEAYYNVPPEVLVYCILYQWEVNEKLMTFGSPHIGLNQNRDAAKITQSFDSVENVYGSVLVDPTLDALYVWKVHICSELEADSIEIGLGFIGQPNESFTPPVDGDVPFFYDFEAKNACIYYANDGSLDGKSRNTEHKWRTSGPWGSRDLLTIVVDTKHKTITCSRGGYASEYGPWANLGKLWSNLEKWEAMNFEESDGEHVYGDEDDDINPHKVGKSLRIDETQDINEDDFELISLDWSVPFRLALCMEGNGWFKVNQFDFHLEGFI